MPDKRSSRSRPSVPIDSGADEVTVDGLERARDAVADGSAQAVLEDLREF